MENDKQNDLQQEDQTIPLAEAGKDEQDMITAETSTEGSDMALEVTSTDGHSNMASDTGPPKGLKENLYDKIPLTVKQLDIIIILLILAFIFFFVVGALKGRGIL